MRNGILSLILLSSPILCSVHAAPAPQAETKPTSPPNRPAQAQVMIAPNQVTSAQLPAKEPMPADARNPDRILRVGHRGAVQALAFSPDGRWLASGGYDKVIIVWNLSSGREEFRLGGQKDTIAPPQQPLEKEAISSLAFNPDGTRLVSMHVSGVIRIWSLQTQKMLFAVNPHRIHSYGESLAYSADGKSLIIALEKRLKETTETAIGFYDADTGKRLRTVPTPWSLVSALVPTSDGHLIAAGTMGADDDDDPSGSVQIFDGNTGSVQKTYPVVASSISADGRWMTSIEEAGPSGPHAILWSLGDGKRVHDLPLRNSGRLVFRPDGEEVAILHGDSNAIDFVSTASGQITKSLPGGGYGLGMASYSADGKLLAASTYAYGTIKVWDLGSMRAQAALHGQSPVQSVTFSPDGKLLAATSGELRIWDVATLSEMRTLTDAPVSRAQEKGFPAFWLAFSEAESAPQKIGNVWSWQFVSEGLSHLWGSSLPMAMSPDGKWLAQPAVVTGAVEIWDATSGQKVESIPATKLVVTKLSFSRDGRWLITVGQDSNPMMVQGQPGVSLAFPRVSVWNTATWKLEFSITFPSTAGTDAEISADGKFLAVAKGSVIQLFDLEQKKPVAVLASPDGLAGFLAISPDGELLVQGAQDGVRVWKLSTIPAARN